MASLAPPRGRIGGGGVQDQIEREEKHVETPAERGARRRALPGGELRG